MKKKTVKPKRQWEMWAVVKPNGLLHSTSETEVDAQALKGFLIGSSSPFSDQWVVKKVLVTEL